MTTKRPSLAGALTLAMGLAVAGCSESSGPEHDHPHAGDAAHAPHAGDGERAALVYTDYTPLTELFVEFPALVVGKPSAFAAHVTRLADYQPLTAGTLDVLLQQGGETVARFRVNAPARAGIFMPTVVPRRAGTFDLSLRVAEGDLEASHELGPVTVFTDEAAVTISADETEGEIGYLKEQQWVNPFATTVAQHRPLRPSVPGFATVQAPADAGAEVRAPSDGYFATADLVQAGERVAAGDVLGYLVPRLGDGTDVGSLGVALARARAQTTLAEQDQERLQGLFEQGAIPERRLIEARQTLAVARAELRAAEARLDQYESGDGQAGVALRAPVGGEVVEANAQPGAFVRAGERIFHIVGPDRRWLRVEVPEHFAAGLRNASGAWFEHDEQSVVIDPAHGGRVVATGLAIDPTSRTASVTLEYPTHLGPALVGSRLPAHVFTAAPEERLAIPRRAVIDDDGRPVAYVQSAGETFARRPVELGLVDGDWVEVLSGVSPGDRVVSRGAYYVKLAAAGGQEIGHGHAH